MLFGHGAGTPMRAPLMHQMSASLANRGIATFRYDYPYSHRLETGYTEDLIDPLDVLLATTRAAAATARTLAPNLPLFLGGRSMSSQVMSLSLARERWPHVSGLVLYVFPMRWRVLLPDTVAHLRHVPVPMLFVQGDRDHEFADLAELQPVLNQLGNRATLHVIPGADHSFSLPPQSAKTQQDALTEAATTTAAWIRRQLETAENAPLPPAHPPTRARPTRSW